MAVPYLFARQKPASALQTEVKSDRRTWLGAWTNRFHMAASNCGVVRVSER